MDGERTARAAAVLKRLREPSTWAGLSVLLALAGINPVVVQLAGSVLDVLPTALQVLSAGSAAVAVAVSEKGAS